MASDKIEYCRDRCFPTKHVPLPQTFLLDRDVKVSVNYARTDQLPDLLAMVELAEQRGDNVGINELSNNLAITDFILHGSEIFAVTNLKTHTVVAFIVLHQCIYIRGYDTCLGTIRLFRSPSLGANDAAYGGLIRLATDFAAKIDYGYTHVIIDVALCLTNLLKVLKSLDFMVTAIIPNAVNIKGFGVVDNAILIKSLGISDRPGIPEYGTRKLYFRVYKESLKEISKLPRSLAEVMDMLQRGAPCEEFMVNYPTMELPQVPFLPQTYTFKSRVRATLRNMTKEDDEKMFDLLKNSAEKGEGFALTEYPSLVYFRMHFLSSCYSVIIEEIETKEIIGFILLSSTWYHRLGDDSQHYGGDIVLNRRFRGKGIASEMIPIERGIARELGFIRSVHDHFLFNARMSAAAKHAEGTSPCGVLPNAGYVVNMGWEDVLMGCAYFPNAPTFTKLVQENEASLSKL